MRRSAKSAIGIDVTGRWLTDLYQMRVTLDRGHVFATELEEGQAGEHARRVGSLLVRDSVRNHQGQYHKTPHTECVQYSTALTRFDIDASNASYQFLRETFDALFAISESTTYGSLSVYNAIVHVIGILVDERASVFTNFQPVLDAYLENHFKVSKAHETLLNALFKQLQDTSNIRQMICTFKV
jgi:hypothetical protein